MAVKIGELLVSKNLLTPEQVDKALEYQKKYGGKLGSVLVELDFVSDHDLAQALSEQLHLPAALSDEFKNIPKTAIDAMPMGFVKAHSCVPLLVRGRLRVAISDPWEIKAINEWALSQKKQVQMVIAPEIWIIAAMERYYGVIREGRFHGLVDEVEVLPTEEAGEIIELVDEVVEEELDFPVFQQKLSECRSMEEMFDTLLHALAPIYPQIAVYVARKGSFQGWVVQGFPLRPRDFSKVQVPIAKGTPMGVMAEVKEAYTEPITPEQAKAMGFETMQIPFSTQVRFYPILFRGNVSTVVLVIPGEQEHHVTEKDEKYMLIACKKMEAALEMLAYRRIILAPATI